MNSDENRIPQKIMNVIKRFLSYPLFAKNADGMDKKGRSAYFFFNAVLLLASCIWAGLASLLLAYGPGYSNSIFIDYLAHPFLLFLNIAPIVLVTLLLYAITGISWIAYFVTSFAVLGLSFSNYYLLKFRDDPLMFSDLLFIKEAANISSEGYDYSLGLRMIFAILTCVFFAAVLFLLQRYRPGKKIRILLCALTLVVGSALSPLYISDNIYAKKTDNYDHVNRWSSTQYYISKGFVYPFIYSIKESFITTPNGYDEDRAKTLLSSYEDADIPEDKKINVVGIMVEAFCDLENIGITGINEDVYSTYRKLRDENLSGQLVTNVFGGNTIQSERAFLTGCSRVDNFRHNVNSYVRYFTSQGYYTDGAHPSEEWFYNRKNINKYIGFENYRFAENHFAAKYGIDMRLDANVLPDIFEYTMGAIKNGDRPYFGFSITYQGHGPYATTYHEWGNGTYYNNPDVSEESNYILDNYLGSVKDTGWRLYQFAEQIKAEKEPIVLVLFGDHKPWLGDGNSVYHELGINIDTSTYEGFLNYYGTEYIIVANDAAKEIIGNDFTGEGPLTSPCFLMNVLFDNLGWEGPAFMQYTDSVRESLVALNTEGAIDSDGNFSPYSTLDGKLVDVKDDYVFAQYYYLHESYK